MKLKKFLFLLAVTATVFLVGVFGYILNLKSGIADSVLRLHIVAESDSAYDQVLKLCVRDRIFADFSDVLNSSSSVADAKATVTSLLSEIRSAAEDELKARGCYLPVSAEVSECRFPTKTYGNTAFPGGRYTSLNIKIGDAKGRNWWCVLYPPLCMTDSTVVMPDSSAEKLKDYLSPEEYRLITESESPDIKIKFKIAEMLGKYFK